MAMAISSITELNKKGCGYRVAITRGALYLLGMNAEVSRAIWMKKLVLTLISALSIGSASAGQVEEQLFQCAYLTRSAISIVKLAATGNNKQAVELHQETMKNIVSKEMADRYYVALGTAKERHTEMKPAELKSFMVQECTH